MTCKIYKYPLEIGVTTVKMPFGGKVLTAQDQGGTINLWAMVLPDAPSQRRTFEIVGTGHPLAGNILYENYIATVQQGSFVWHVFELK